MRLICKSRTYQLSVAHEQVERGRQDQLLARRWPAGCRPRCCYDAVHRVDRLDRRSSRACPPAPGPRRCPTRGVELPSGFLATFGRPARESACECERTSGLQLGPIMALVSGPTLADAIADPNNELAKLVAQRDGRRQAGRRAVPAHPEPPGDAGRDRRLPRGASQAIEADHRKLAAALGEREAEVAPISGRSRSSEREAAIADGQGRRWPPTRRSSPRSSPSRRSRRPRGSPQLEAELKDYEATLAGQARRVGEDAVDGRPVGRRSIPKTLKATQRRHPDEAGRPVDRSPPARTGKGDYTVVAETDLNGITGIRLEVLADDRLPQKGPGPRRRRQLRPDRVRGHRRPARPTRRRPSRSRSQNALADFSQDELRRRKRRSTATPTRRQGLGGRPRHSA